LSNLYDRILAASEMINKSSRKGSANYMVVSPSVASMLNKILYESDKKSDFRKDKIKKIFMKDEKFILKGVLQEFDTYTSNGRIYPYKSFRRYSRKIKIKMLFNDI
jgi:hypothetical protein